MSHPYLSKGEANGRTDAAGPRVAPLLQLSEAEQVVDALNQAFALDVTPRERARALLRSYQRLLGDDFDVQLILHENLERPEGPIVVDRVTVGPLLEKLEPRPNAEVQAAIDSSTPAVRMIVPDTLANLRMPRVFIVGQDLPPEHQQWYQEKIVDVRLTPNGWSDLMIGCWASGNDRMVAIYAYERLDRPKFGYEERRLASLMLRAAAPFIHHEMFDAEQEVGGRTPSPSSPLAGRELSTRQRDVLRLLLRGLSEKEAANELGVSTHTVHTHVKRLYTEFDVTSRGELLALFVDRRVLCEAEADGEAKSSA